MADNDGRDERSANGIEYHGISEGDGMKKRVVCIMAVAMLFVAMLVGCQGKTNDTKQAMPLNTENGIGDQSNLFGMCYSTIERAYSSNTNFDIEAEVRLLANLGVKSVRNWMHLDDLLLSPVTVNTAAAEKMHRYLAVYEKYGLQVIGMSHTSFHGGSYRTGKPARNIQQGSEYLEWLDNYYKSWKTLAAEFDEVSYWEIDNEMNNPDFMCDLDGNKVYSQDQMAEIAADMLYYGSKGIHESNPSAMTIMGGLTEPNGLGSGQNKSFLEKLYVDIFSGEFGLYAEDGTVTPSINPDDYFEAACWHPYLGSAQYNEVNFLKFNNEIYQVILDNEQKHKKVFFTEMGFSEQRYTEDQCAQYITEMYKTVANKMPYVESIHYFKMFNVAAIGWTGTVSRYGLFYDPDPNRIDYNQHTNERRTPGAPNKKAFAYQAAAGGTGSLNLIKRYV